VEASILALGGTAFPVQQAQECPYRCDSIFASILLHISI